MYYQTKENFSGNEALKVCFKIFLLKANHSLQEYISTHGLEAAITEL